MLLGIDICSGGDYGAAQAAEGIGSVVDSVIEEASGLAEPTVALWAPGSAVLAAGEGEYGQPAVAVWQVSPDVI